MNDKFWVEDPCILFLDPVFFPSNNQTREQKLNALTRLVIVVTVIMYISEYDNWLLFLVVALLVIILIQYISKSREYEGGKLRENFTFTNRYTDLPYERTNDGSFITTLAPPQAETELLPPVNFDTGETELIPLDGYNNGDMGNAYMTHTTLLPETESTIMTSQPAFTLNQAMDYANNSWIYNRDINHRREVVNNFRRIMNQRNISGNYTGYKQPSCLNTTQPYVFP